MNILNDIRRYANLNEMAIEKAQREGVISKMKTEMNNGNYNKAVQIFKEAGGKNFTKDYTEVFTKEELAKLKSAKPVAPKKPVSKDLYDKAENALEAYSTILAKRQRQRQQIEDNTSKGVALLKKDSNAKNKIESDIEKYENNVETLKEFLSLDKEKYKEENFAELSKEEKKVIMDNLSVVKKIISAPKPKEDIKGTKKGARLGPKEKEIVSKPYEDKRAFEIAKKYADSGVDKTPTAKQLQALKHLMDVMYRPNFDPSKKNKRVDDSKGSKFPLENKKEIATYAKYHNELKDSKKQLDAIKKPEDIDPGDYADIFDTIETLYNTLSEDVHSNNDLNEMIHRLKKLG